MKDALQTITLDATRARSITSMETIQTLWSGYGEIVRVGLKGAASPSVVVKYISPPVDASHPRGWNSERSHQRKLRSYEVELHWYSHWSGRCGADSRLPRCLHATSADRHRHLIILEDLDSAGYPVRKGELTLQETMVSLRWLANFHATFMGESPTGLWSEGSYWHLDTRPDELAAMADGALKRAARKIDRRLRQSRFQTFVHGDAKVANFCFSEDGQEVAMVDFQYVGGGCGMKDVAYFLGSCLSAEHCEHWQEQLLDGYFRTLKEALATHHKELDFDALEREWRQLYPVAWADFQRFLVGWSPDHWKLNDYSDRLTEQVLRDLGEE